MNFTSFELGHRLTEDDRGSTLEIRIHRRTMLQKRGLNSFVIRPVIRYIEQGVASNRPDGYQPDNDEVPGYLARYLRSRYSFRRR